jgi:hypothetical protein
MKLFLTISSLLFLLTTTIAQEVIKTGEETSITCTGTLVSETQHYFSNGNPSSKGKTFIDFQKDSLIVFNAFINNGSSHSVYRYSVAKKDINNEEDAIGLNNTKENGAPFLLVELKTKELNNLIQVQFHSKGEIENEDSRNSFYLYFAPDKEADQKEWKQKLETALK